MLVRGSDPPAKVRDRARSRRGSVILLSLAAALIALVLPVPAQGAVPVGFTPCPGESGYYCGTVTVPIDRSGLDPLLVGKTIALSVVWKPARIANTDGALVALAGGPGQAAVPFTPSFDAALEPALGTRDLIVFDQRGTGDSGLLSCPGAASATTLAQFVQVCTSEMGPARDHYSSKDSAADIDAVRAAVGVEKVTVFGVSYGTYVAQLYAKLFPTHTAALVLDSVVSANGVDPFLRSNFAALPRVLAANCARKLCSGITRDSFADLKSVVARAGTTGMSLRYVGSTGRAGQFRASRTDLFSFMVENYSVDAVARARLPGALRSALAGDPYPLGRLLAPSPPSTGIDPSLPLYMATSCTDTTFPWALNDPLSVRQTDATNALNAISPAAFSPFSSATALDLSNIFLCIDWPPATVDRSVTAPAPDIPVLVLDGLEDDLTPLSDGAAVAALYPHAVRVSVPFTGHSAISDVWPNADRCVSRALTSFFAHMSIPSCSYVTPFFRPTTRDPSSLAQVKPLRLKGTRGRTIGAVLRTLTDVTYTNFSMMERPVGLRGGSFGGSMLAPRLHKIVYVPGVVVSGSLDLLTGVSRVTVTGKGSHGTLVIRRGKQFTSVTGKLDGKKLKIRVRTSANDSEVAKQLQSLLGFSLARYPIRRPAVTPGAGTNALRIGSTAFRMHFRLWG